MDKYISIITSGQERKYDKNGVLHYMETYGIDEIYEGFFVSPTSVPVDFSKLYGWKDKYGEASADKLRYMLSYDLKKTIMKASAMVASSCDEVGIYSAYRSSESVIENELILILIRNGSSVELTNSDKNILMSINTGTLEVNKYGIMAEKNTLDITKWIMAEKMNKKDRDIYRSMKIGSKYPVRVSFVGKSVNAQDKEEMTEKLSKSLFILDKSIGLNKCQDIKPHLIFGVEFHSMMYTGTYRGAVIKLGTTPFTTPGTLFHEYGHYLHESLTGMYCANIIEHEKAIRLTNKIICMALNSPSYQKNAKGDEDKEAFATIFKCCVLLDVCETTPYKEMEGYYVFHLKNEKSEKANITFVDNLEFGIEDIQAIFPLFRELVEMIHEGK